MSHIEGKVIAITGAAGAPAPLSAGSVPSGNAAAGVHDVDIGSAVVRRRERDVRPVRAELGVSFAARMAGNPAGVPARGGRQPQIVLIGEDDGVAVDIGPPHEVRFIRRDRPRRCTDQNEYPQQISQLRHGFLPQRLVGESHSSGRWSNFVRRRAAR